ncbi:MAG: hypothetical protein ACI9BW_001669 [Gammaproteobacteria bacterium]|jgi:hypothetical protein
MATDRRICQPLKISLCAIAAIWSICLTPLQAADQAIGENVRDFTLDRYHDARRLIQGPRAIVQAAVPANISCIELYERRLELLRQTEHHKPSYWDDPRNQAAVFIGTIWTPAFYFLSYSAVAAHLDGLNADEPLPNLDALRRASAAKRCFEK